MELLAGNFGLVIQLVVCSVRQNHSYKLQTIDSMHYMRMSLCFVRYELANMFDSHLQLLYGLTLFYLVTHLACQVE
jgi:hypothetical protein